MGMDGEERMEGIVGVAVTLTPDLQVTFYGNRETTIGPRESSGFSSGTLKMFSLHF